MKRLVLLIILLFSFFTVISQELTDSHINKVDAQGRRQGKWRVYDGDGNLKFTGEFINGKPVGEFKFLYPNGKTKAIVQQLDSGRIAYTTNYHPNGNIMARGKYVDQKKDSTWLYYTEEDGFLASEESYDNGLKEGSWKIYYPDGKIAEETFYSHDLKEGPWIQYFTDGTIKMKAAYISDKLEGSYTIYHVNGKVEVSGIYLHDNKDGTWIYLTDIGELEKREEYRNGKLISQEIIEVDK